MPSNTWKAGDNVEVCFRTEDPGFLSTFWPAQIVEVKPSSIKVKYKCLDHDIDCINNVARIRPVAPIDMLMSLDQRVIGEAVDLRRDDADVWWSGVVFQTWDDKISVTFPATPYDPPIELPKRTYGDPHKPMIRSCMVWKGGDQWEKQPRDLVEGCKNWRSSIANKGILKLGSTPTAIGKTNAKSGGQDVAKPVGKAASIASWDEEDSDEEDDAQPAKQQQQQETALKAQKEGTKPPQKPAAETPNKRKTKTPPKKIAGTTDTANAGTGAAGKSKTGGVVNAGADTANKGNSAGIVDADTAKKGKSAGVVNAGADTAKKGKTAGVVNAKADTANKGKSADVVNAGADADKTGKSAGPIEASAEKEKTDACGDKDKPTRTKKPFSDEDHRTYKRVLQEHGLNYTELAKALPERTGNSLRGYWQNMKHVRGLQAIVDAYKAKQSAEKEHAKAVTPSPSPGATKPIAAKQNEASLVVLPLAPQQPSVPSPFEAELSKKQSSDLFGTSSDDEQPKPGRADLSKAGKPQAGQPTAAIKATNIQSKTVKTTIPAVQPTKAAALQPRPASRPASAKPQSQAVPTKLPRQHSKQSLNSLPSQTSQANSKVSKPSIASNTAKEAHAVAAKTTTKTTKQVLQAKRPAGDIARNTQSKRPRVNSTLVEQVSTASVQVDSLGPKAKASPSLGTTKVCIDNLGGCMTEPHLRLLLVPHLPKMKDLRVMSVQLGDQVYHGGWACITFYTEEAASEALERLSTFYLMTAASPIPRPIIAHVPRWLDFPWGQTTLPGHINLGKGVKHAAHFAQPNHMEFDAALQWRQLDQSLVEAKQQLRALHVQELVDVMKKFVEENGHTPVEDVGSVQWHCTPYVWLKGLDPLREEITSDVQFFEQFIPQAKFDFLRNPVTNDKWGHALLRMTCVHHAELLATNINEMVLLLHGTPRLVEAAVAVAGPPIGSQSVYNSALHRVFGCSDGNATNKVSLKIITGEPTSPAEKTALELRELLMRQAKEGVSLHGERNSMRSALHRRHDDWFMEELIKLKHLFQINNKMITKATRQSRYVRYDERQIKDIKTFLDLAKLDQP